MIRENGWPKPLDGLKMLADWRCERELGRGRFGVVYEISRDSGAEGGTEKAALKWVALCPSQNEIDDCPRRGMTLEDLAEKYDARKNQCLGEISIMQSVQGESTLVNYQDYQAYRRGEGQIGWDILIRMELLTPVKEHIRENGMSLGTVLDVGVSMATALSLCHHGREGRQIIHGDVKLENCYFSRDNVYKLGDFGLSFTGEQAAVGGGTRVYLAPECMAGETKSVYSDQYALGMSMYVLLNDMHLPEGMSSFPRPQRCTNSKLWQIISRMLQQDPADRFGDMQEVLEKLKALRLTEAERTTVWNPLAPRQEDETPLSAVSTRTDYMQKQALEERKEGYLAGRPDLNAGKTETVEEKKEDTKISRVSDDLLQVERQRQAQGKKKRRFVIMCAVAAAVVIAMVAAVLLWPKPAAGIGKPVLSQQNGKSRIEWSTHGTSGPYTLIVARDGAYPTVQRTDLQEASLEVTLCPGEAYAVQAASGETKSETAVLSVPEKPRYEGGYQLEQVYLRSYTIRPEESGPEQSRDQETCSEILLNGNALEEGGKGYFLRLRYTAQDAAPETLPLKCYILCGSQETQLEGLLTKDGSSMNLVLNDALRDVRTSAKMKCKIYAEDCLLLEMTAPVVVK